MLYQNKNIKENDFFGVLKNQEKKLLEKNITRGSTLPREYLYKNDSNLNFVFFIRKGTVLVGNNLGNLNEFNLLLTMQPLFLGLESLILREGNEQFAKTLSDVYYVKIPKEVISILLERNDMFHRVIQRHLADFLSAIEYKYYLLHSKVNYIDRLKQFIEEVFIENSKNTNQSERVVLHITHQEIARYIHCSRASVAYCLSKMRKEGIVEYNREEIFIKDLQKIKSWTNKGK